MPPGPMMKCSLVANMHRDQHVGAEHERIGRRLGKQRQAGQQHQRRNADDLDQRAWPAGSAPRHRRRCAPRPAGGRAGRSGRTISTTAMTRNSATSVSLEKLNGEAAEIDHADADADRLDLRDQDGGEIGAGDRAHAADHHHDEGVADHGQVHAADWRARARPACAPPRPARNAPSANTAVNSIAWLMPSAPTISRSWVAARTRRPKRVFVSSEMQDDQHRGPIAIRNRS